MSDPSSSLVSSDAFRRATRDAYRKIVVRRLVVLAVLVLLVVVFFSVDIATGPSAIPIRTVWNGLFSPERLTAPELTILRDVRLPCAIAALLVGSSLALAGAEMQTTLDNPLASPFTLGVSSAASFGAALGIILEISVPFVPADWTVPVDAFLCALGSVLLLEALARSRGADRGRVVLFGIALVFTFNSAVALLQFVASQEALSQLVFWNLGSLGRTTWASLGVIGAVMLVVTPLSLRSAHALTALRLGEDRARSFGVDVGRLRFASLVRISALAATSVAFVGTIGFVGLVGPHIARLLVGEDHRFALPASMLTGALVVSGASIASKSLVHGAVLPIGIVTSMIGVPVFLVLILRRPERV